MGISEVLDLDIDAFDIIVTVLDANMKAEERMRKKSK